MLFGSRKWRKNINFSPWIFGDPAGIKYLVSIFTGQKIKIIAPYLPGHGKSFNLPNGINFREYVKVTADFIKNLNLKEFVILGSSFGGRIGWEIINCIIPGCKAALLHAPPLDSKINLSKIIPGLIVDWVIDVSMGIWKKLTIKNWLPETVKVPSIARFNFWQLPRLIKLFTTAKAPTNMTNKNIEFLWGKSDRTVCCPENLLIKTKFYSGGHFWFLRHYPEFHREVYDFVEKYLTAT